MPDAVFTGRIEVQAAGVSGLSVVGEWLGWDLSRALQLRDDGKAQGGWCTTTQRGQRRQPAVQAGGHSPPSACHNCCRRRPADLD